MEMLILIAILAFMVVAFAWELMPIDLVALVSLALLLVFDLVTPEEATAGFSNPAVITVMMMFIVSEGLVRSGLVNVVAHRIAGMAGRSSFAASTALLVLAGGLSAFINNTAAVAIFMPVAIYLAKQYQFSPSKILLPLSYACIFGGACTLIGTSTNLLVSSMATDYGMEPLGVFEFLSMGSVLFAAGMIYTVVRAQSVLPARGAVTSLTTKYQMSAFLTEIKVPQESKLVGRTVVSEQLSDRFRLNVLEILRGRQKISQDLRNTRIRADDVLLLRGAMEDIVSFKQQYGLLLLTDIKLSDSDLDDENNILAEVQLSPMSKLEGRTLKEIDFRRRHGCFVLAINRTGDSIRDKVAMIPLKRWDTLLVFGPRGRVEGLYDFEDFVSLQERDLRLHLDPRWWLGALIVPIVVLLAATGLMDIMEASILGAVTMVATRRLRIQEAYKSINWTVIFLVAAILPVGTAMKNTGLADLVGHGIGAAGARFGPWAVLAVIYLATTLLTEIMSNNSTVVLMVPIAASVATTLGVDPKPFLMAVAFAGSASFLTPMGYNTNAMVYAPGGYRFQDYIRLGWPLKVLFWLISTAVIPLIWRF
ncbi:MAG: SLC13 family permease [Acidobacteria bacterium]|nr:SLC13 family permease [Acidobacteriota bacterium]